jgi:transcription antitermination factor NusG
MRAHDCLHLRGWKPYLPLITIRTPKREYRTQALYPGYLFVSLDLSRPWHPVTACPGVFSLLSIEGTPTPCPRGVVEALRAGEELRRTPNTSETPHRPGDACSVAHGAFAGHRGAVLRVTSQRAVVALVILGGLREVTLPLDSLAPAN